MGPLSLACRPPPKVTWWRDGLLLDDSYEALPGGRARNLLRLERLQRSHADAQLTCQASNNELVAPATASVTLDLNPRTQSSLHIPSTFSKMMLQSQHHLALDAIPPEYISMQPSSWRYCFDSQINRWCSLEERPTRRLQMRHTARDQAILSSAKEVMKFTCSEYWDMAMAMAMSHPTAKFLACCMHPTC
ncbi:hypothetical protein PR048_025030 [Dryococelus australis]|uniref:Ig-like domain-containing protein n=1 Tax=Dryococelus australis TaxID=614101 RepID=A0ABQ9GQ82_9NEOP|nr:hypothetical protein PR048_025030 [Dryococelus australis]